LLGTTGSQSLIFIIPNQKIMLPIEVSVHCNKLHVMGLNVVLFCF
jgi:hypothetical protein